MISERRRILLLGRTLFRRMFESDLMSAGLPQVQLVTGTIVRTAHYRAHGLTLASGG